MSQPKAAATTFTTDWAKIKGWAGTQKINPTAVQNVQALDQSRLQGGYYPMSNAERTRAILAAAGLNYNTALPSDSPGASDVVGNTISNVRSIVTGLMPTRLVANIFDTLKTSVDDLTHPGDFTKNGGMAGAMTGSVLSWIPGVYDLGTIAKAGSLGRGLEDLAKQPVTSILDVIPALKFADAASGARVAATSTGDVLASRLGMTPKAVGQLGAVRMMGKGLGSITLGSKPGEVLDHEGNSVIRPLTIAERASRRAVAAGMGGTLSKAAHGLMSIGNKYTIQYRRVTKDLVTAVSKLSKDETDAAGRVLKKGELTVFNEIMHSGREASDIINDGAVPLKVREAVKAYQPWEEQHREYMLTAGKIMPLKLPDGTVQLYESTSPVWLAAQRADDALAAANEASAKSDQLSQLAIDYDQAHAPVLARLRELKQAVAGVPAMMGENMPAAYAKMFGRLVGRDGLLEQMEQAVAAHDWVAFRDAAKKADKAMSSQHVKGAEGSTRPARVMGRPVTQVRDEAKAMARVPKDHIRFFRHDGPGEGWSTSFREAQAAAGNGKVYKVDIPASQVSKFFAQGELKAMHDYQHGKPMVNAVHHRTGHLGPIERNVSKATIPGWDNVPMLAELRDLIGQKYEYGKKRLVMEKEYLKAFEGTTEASRKKSAQSLNKLAAAKTEHLMKKVRDHPPAEYRDVVLNSFFKKFLESDMAEQLLDESAAYLKGKGFDKELVERIRSNPKKLYELVAAVAGPTFTDPFIPQMTKTDHLAFMQDALNEADSLRARGYKPMYVPTTGARFAGSPYLADDRVYVNPLKYPTISASFKKAMDMSSTVNDVMLGVSKATKEQLGKDATIEFMDTVLKPMLRTGTSLRMAIAKEHLGQIETDVTATALGDIDSLIEHHYGLIPFDVKGIIGLHQIEAGKIADPALAQMHLEDFGLKEGETYYLPKSLAHQVEGLVGRDQFPLHGGWDKVTGVFKYSILGLSPRYTAHILFGGSMLLALRINPGSFAYIHEAAKAVKAYHHGEDGAIPSEVFQGAAQRGSPDVEVHFRGGWSMGYLTIQERLVKMGLNPKTASLAQHLTAAADINFRFTNYISDMQRSIAYLDGMRSAERKGHFNDPITGEKIHMTSDRAHWEGMQAAERVMGNLQAMTPLERSVARKIMPFYGWTKHILKYVLTYPIDHPWRAMFLSTLATQNSDNFASGLDQRMQLLFFLGAPDKQGNVSAIDVRALNPFRDVANYATYGGWISSLNPVITAPFAMIDPSIVFGGNVLHPSVTYDAVYGTNTAGAAGGWLTAAEQEIPELSVLDNALGLSAKARSIRAQGGNAYAKSLFQSLNIPFAQVQHLNLEQISAKHEIDRFQQAKADALNAWQTGDFSALSKYPGTVPDPLQSGYNITPAQLQKQYAKALKANPGLPPSETVPNLTAPPL